jgi:Eukaryotic protein of unknown function (DUF866)
MHSTGQMRFLSRGTPELGRCLCQCKKKPLVDPAVASQVESSSVLLAPRKSAPSRDQEERPILCGSAACARSGDIIVLTASRNLTRCPPLTARAFCQYVLDIGFVRHLYRLMITQISMRHTRLGRTRPTTRTPLSPLPRSNAVDANSQHSTQRSASPHAEVDILRHAYWFPPFRSFPPLRHQGTWQCKGVDSGTVFDNVEFEEGEWVDYDEKVTKARSQWITLSFDSARPPASR